MTLMWENISPCVLKEKGEDIYIKKLLAMADELKSEEQIDNQHLQISINYGRGNEFFGPLKAFKL